MITIQAADVAELKKIFGEMFGQIGVNALSPVKMQTEKILEAPVEKPKAPDKKKEEDQTPALPVAAEGTIVVEVPESTGDRTCTYEEVLGKVKQLKASTVPDILDKVNAWKTKGGFPALKESTPEQLGFAMTFIESLEG